MAFMKILMDCADGHREGIVIGEPELMPNVDGHYIIRVKPMGFQGLFTTYEITNIPKGGWYEWKRPDGNITFVLLMNESGNAPLLEKIGIMAAEAAVKLNEQTKIMAIREKRQNTEKRKVSENALSIVNESREILDAWEKKKTNPNDMRQGFRNNYI